MADTDETGETAPAEQPVKIVLYMDDKPYEVPSDPHKLPVSHVNAVERATGMTVDEWADKLTPGTVSMLAISALAWVAKRMAGETVKWHDFENNLSCGELVDGMRRVPGDQ